MTSSSFAIASSARGLLSQVLRLSLRLRPVILNTDQATALQEADGELAASFDQSSRRDGGREATRPPEAKTGDEKQELTGEALPCHGGEHARRRLAALSKRLAAHTRLRWQPLSESSAHCMPSL